MPIFEVRPPDARRTRTDNGEGGQTPRGELRVSPEGVSMSAVRASVRRMLRKHAIPESVIDDVVLVISELVTNAVLHGTSDGAESEALLTVAVAESLVKVEVSDRSPLGPAECAASESAENGRGLAVVSALVDRWGWEPIPGGKVVWCELAARPEQTAGQRA